MRRIGVFVCHCGSNIAATVDVKKVVEMAALEQGVVHAEDYPYMCSEAGQQRIALAIREKDLSGIVVCSGSPRMHEATFRKAAERAARAADPLAAAAPSEGTKPKPKKKSGDDFAMVTPLTVDIDADIRTALTYEELNE